jgi:hypothetical protein
LNAKGYSTRDERRLLDALGRGLLKEFPNPERTGCPGADVLKRIACRTMPLNEAGKWLDHLGSCSPCYSDFSRFRKVHEFRRRRTVLAIAASVLVAAGIAGWFLLQRHNESLIAQTVVLDLRNRSRARGTEPLPDELPLEIPRTVSHLEIYLPLGSTDGSYDLRVSTLHGLLLFSGKGVARIEQGATLLPVDVNLRSVDPALYVLQVQQNGSGWNSYPLRIK